MIALKYLLHVLAHSTLLISPLFAQGQSTDWFVDVYVGDNVLPPDAERSGYHTFRIPALLKAANGDLLAFAEARRDSEEDHGKVDLVLKRSQDGGRTWGPLTKVFGIDHPEKKITVGNPVPILDQDGTIHLICSVNNRLSLLHLVSKDHGATWSEPREFGEPGKAYRYLDDLSGLPVQNFGPGPGRGLRLKSGRLVVPIWVTTLRKHPPFQTPAPLDQGPLEGMNLPPIPENKPRFNALLFMSDDHGQTWFTGAVAPAEASESTVVELPDGRLVMNSRIEETGHFRMISISEDQGMTFSRSFVTPELVDIMCQGSSTLFQKPDGTSTIYFVNPAVQGRGFRKRANLTVFSSKDGISGWETSRVVFPGPSGYSDIIQLDGQSLGVFFECGEKDYFEKIRFAAVPVAPSTN